MKKHEPDASELDDAEAYLAARQPWQRDGRESWPSPPVTHINGCSSFFSSTWRRSPELRFTFVHELLGRIWSCR